MFLETCDAPILLDPLADRICNSSNFRFDWQFYQFRGIDPRSPQGVRRALDQVIATPHLHEFLNRSFHPLYADAFAIEPAHSHCRIQPADGELEAILGLAAEDHLGAYSRTLRNPTDRRKEKAESDISQLFASVGEYCSFQLLPGEVPDCPVCRNYDNHLFSNWFYAVAWDWCLFATWAKPGLFWMGCLTDTD